MVCEALRELDIPAVVNQRHDIAIDNKKVSGSAFKLVNKRAYHHGTMLIDTDLDLLERYLSPTKKQLTGLGTDSVRSKVTRLRDYSYTIDHISFCEAVGHIFHRQYGQGEMNPILLDEDSITNDIQVTLQQLQVLN